MDFIVTMSSGLTALLVAVLCLACAWVCGAIENRVMVRRAMLPQPLQGTERVLYPTVLRSLQYTQLYLYIMAVWAGYNHLYFTIRAMWRGLEGIYAWLL